MGAIQNTDRTSYLMSTTLLRESVQRTQSELLRAQSQITTGKKYTATHEAADQIAMIQLLRQQLSQRDQHLGNLEHAGRVLDTTDQSLADANALLLEVKSITSSQIGVGGSQQSRENSAVIIDAKLQSMLEIANRSIGGVNLFGGSASTGRVFEEFLGGVRYVGGEENLGNQVGLANEIDFNSNGKDVFAALSSRIETQVDLNPQATAETALDSVEGAQGRGVRRGVINVSVDGTQVSVDLSKADTLGDVVTRVNDAIASVDAGAGSLAVAGQGLELTAAGGRTINITDVTGGAAAADLGVATSATGAAVAGEDINPRLTNLTQLSALDTPVDWSGLTITQGSHTRSVDLTSAQSVQDVINAVEGMGLGVSMRISDDGTGLDLVSTVSGLEMSVSENGGTTASDLGIRSFGVDTKLSSFNAGRGVSTLEGENDFAIELHDGQRFEVNADGLNSVQDVLDAIGAAASAAGLSVGAPGDGGTDLNIGLPDAGNGFVFEDGTAGGNDFRVVQLSTSQAASDLGIYQNAAGGNVIDGEDVAKVRVESVFTHLMELSDSLKKNDSTGITFAGERVEEDILGVTRARADAGARAKRVQTEQQRFEELKIMEQSFLSNMEDTDLTEAITRFQQLMQQMQASMQVGAQSLQQSFLDFLR